MAKVIFFGTPDYVVPVLQALKEAEHEILGIVTQPPKPVGRKQVLTPSPVAKWAKYNGINIIEEIGRLKSDVGIVASYGKIIPQSTLDLFPKGILNIHPSLLPKYRGASPIQAAIFYGDKTTGVTIIKMDAGMDTGVIVSQEGLVISDSDSFESLCINAFKLGAEILVGVLPDYLSDRVTPYQQDHAQASYTWKTSETREKAHFDINNAPNLEAIDRMSRAFYPWPNAWTVWKRDTQNGIRDTIIKFLPNKMIQLEGKKPVTWKQFKEGYPDFPLELV